MFHDATAESLHATEATVAHREGTLGEAIATAREGLMSMRELARRSGISTAQISRIESGAVDAPTPQTLIAIARALDLSPIPLLILAGHIDQHEARQRLLATLAPGTEVWESWTKLGHEFDADHIAEMRSVLEDPDSTRAHVGEVARNLFLTPEMEETAWHDSMLLAAAEGPGAAELREVAQLWPALEAGRRQRVMEFLRDQVELSRAQWARDVDAIVAERDQGQA
jgi:transcriptional regulator with XRE-family HTH domain